MLITWLPGPWEVWSWAPPAVENVLVPGGGGQLAENGTVTFTIWPAHGRMIHESSFQQASAGCHRFCFAETSGSPCVALLCSAALTDRERAGGKSMLGKMQRAGTHPARNQLPAGW